MKNRMFKLISPKSWAILGVFLLLNIVVMDAAFANSPWDPKQTEVKVRDFLALGLFLLMGWKALVNYNRGQKGEAVVDILMGVVLSLVVADADTVKAVQGWIKSFF